MATYQPAITAVAAIGTVSRTNCESAAAKAAATMGGRADTPAALLIQHSLLVTLDTIFQLML